MQEDLILKIQNICKSYPGSEENSFIDVLKNISLSIQTGDSISITGPSGSGKSTLLNIMGGLDQPLSGQVFLEDKDMSRMNDDQLSLIRNQKIGFVFQLHHLLPQLTVIENILVPEMAFSNCTSKDHFEKGMELLKTVGMDNRAYHKPSMLSGGELVRTAVVRALINDPLILLADEPTGSLDNQSASDLADLLIKFNKENNLTLVIATHAESLADRMNKKYELKNGYLT